MQKPQRRLVVDLLTGDMPLGRLSRGGWGLGVLGVKVNHPVRFPLKGQSFKNKNGDLELGLAVGCGLGLRTSPELCGGPFCFLAAKEWGAAQVRLPAADSQ